MKVLYFSKKKTPWFPLSDVGYKILCSAFGLDHRWRRGYEEIDKHTADPTDEDIIKIVEAAGGILFDKGTEYHIVDVDTEHFDYKISKENYGPASAMTCIQRLLLIPKQIAI